MVGIDSFHKGLASKRKRINLIAREKMKVWIDSILSLQYHDITLSILLPNNSIAL